MRRFSRLLKIGSARDSRPDQVTKSSYWRSLSSSKKITAKLLAVGLLVSSILILAPTVFLSGAPQKQIGGGSGGSKQTPYVAEAYSFRETPALRDMPTTSISREEFEKLQQVREDREKNIENSERVKRPVDTSKTQPFIDPAINNTKHPDTEPNLVTNPIQNFDGPDMDAVSTINGGGRFAPPDTNAAVGPNHVVVTTNGAMQVYSKTGTSLLGPIKISSVLV